MVGTSPEAMDEDNVDNGDRHPDLDQGASASQNRNELETNSAVNSIDEGVGMGAGVVMSQLG